MEDREFLIFRCEGDRYYMVIATKLRHISQRDTIEDALRSMEETTERYLTIEEG